MGHRNDHSGITLKSLEADLKARFPSELWDLYETIQDPAKSESGPFRLMPIEEVKDLREAMYGFNWRDSCAFWTDDNSNYAGIYLDGPLRGRIYFLSHDEPDFSPVYRSLSSFLKTIREAKSREKDWYEMPTDYFTPTDYYLHQDGKPLPATEIERKSDLEAMTTLRLQFDQTSLLDDDERRFVCFCIMDLTPLDDLKYVLEFLSDKDMWTQERAALILGVHKYSPAIDRLAEIAINGSGNGVYAAINALGRIGTSKCLNAILKCVPIRSKDYAPYLGNALKDCGCEVTHVRGDWQYRLPGESRWHRIQ